MQPAARLRESALPVAHLPSELSPFLLDPSSTLTITPRPPPPKSRGSETAPPGPAASPLTGLPVLRGADAAGAGFLEDAAWPCALPAGCEGRCRGTNGNQISLLLKPPRSHTTGWVCLLCSESLGYASAEETTCFASCVRAQGERATHLGAGEAGAGLAGSADCTEMGSRWKTASRGTLWGARQRWLS